LLARGGRELALGIHDETINKLKGVDEIRTVLKVVTIPWQDSIDMRWRWRWRWRW
jgi:hypothetical protein